MEINVLSDEQLNLLLGKRGAAKFLIEYTSYGREIYCAAKVKVLGADWKRTMSSKMNPERKEIFNQILKTISLRDAQRIYNRGGCLREDILLGIFKYSKKVVKKILNNYCSATWELSERVHIKIVEKFSPKEIRSLCRKNSIHLCDKALHRAFELFSAEDAIVVLSSAPSLSVKMFEYIRSRYSREEIMYLLLLYLDQDGLMWDEIQRRILEKFSKDNAEKIFMKHLQKRGFLGDEVKVMIWHKFPYEDAMQIFRASSKTEKTVDEEVLMLILREFGAKNAYELLSGYVKNGVELPEEVQITIAKKLPSKAAKEILLSYNSKGGYVYHKARRIFD